MFDFWIFFATKTNLILFQWKNNNNKKKNASGIYLQSVWRGAEGLFCSISLEHVQDIKARWKDAFSFLLLPPFSAFSLFSSEFLLLSAPLYLDACATFLTFGGWRRESRIADSSSSQRNRLQAACVFATPLCLVEFLLFLRGGGGVKWGKALRKSSFVKWKKQSPWVAEKCY